ncbi:hypothetical protein [Streptomyces sp. NPDC059479]|uniref:DUF7848 domain-containing protein n=1 Tax=Streptomyces sp. NPDC059479 TaxID=3346848 RepID=UPI0036B2FADE
MIRTVIRSVAWTVRTDTTPDAPAQPLYEAECTTCGEMSGAEEGSRVGPEMWALIHTGKNPSHRSYKGAETTFWRVFPSDGSAVGDSSAEAAGGQ